MIHPSPKNPCVGGYISRWRELVPFTVFLKSIWIAVYESKITNKRRAESKDCSVYLRIKKNSVELCKIHNPGSTLGQKRRDNGALNELCHEIDQNSNSKHKKKRLKTLKEVINNTANAKKGTNGQTGSKYIFQLLFVMFDIVFWERFLFDTKMLFCHLPIIFSLKSSSLPKKKIIGNINPMT